MGEGRREGGGPGGRESLEAGEGLGDHGERGERGAPG